jgi:hypothetical protein
MRRVLTLGLALALAPAAPLLAASKSEEAAFGVVKAFYESANHSECDKAEAFFTDASIKTLKEALGQVGGFSAFCLDKGGKALLKDVKLVKVEVKKQNAEVISERTYVDGSSQLEGEHLVKENGTWKLIFEQKH